jgi:hypothetical protein
MTEDVHIIPVGFDHERLFIPISRNGLDADRVILIHSAEKPNTGEAQKLAERMADKLRRTFESHLGLEVEKKQIPDVHNYKEAYKRGYEMITGELDQGNKVWINISSMPRTVSFAFATAANSLIVEDPKRRDKVHTYYVSPDKYYATEMIEELREQKELLEDLSEDTDDEEVQQRLDSVTELLSGIDDHGTTAGAKELEDGKLHVEIPATPLPDLTDFEKKLLRFLGEIGKAESTSDLGRQLAERSEDEEWNESFRSKVQYNVKNLKEKGFIEREEKEQKYETGLSTMGELWVDTHEIAEN